ncbi:LOW QUALITY PROTEIN: hypothetical protein U0070_015821 [Myodes glareolus]|uniref:Uncharacterized protein n=1 Tax=Myodes glareolus TaxID=447135 RepID=A0AAW0GWL5_MYOGA
MDFLHWSGVLIIQHLQRDYRAYYDFLHFMSNVRDPPEYIFCLLSTLVSTESGCWNQDDMGSSYRGLVQPYIQMDIIWASSKKLRFTQITQAHALTSFLLHTDLVLALECFLVDSSWCLYLQSVHSNTFPHQVIVGVMGGIHIASLNVYRKSNIFLFLFALGFYLLLRLLNIDLPWSLPIAKKWCANPDWIHIDSTLFAGLKPRGPFWLGFRHQLQNVPMSCRGENGRKLSFQLLRAMTSLITLQLYCFIQIPTHREPWFYLLPFCKSTSIPLAVVALILYCVHMLMRPS